MRCCTEGRFFKYTPTIIRPDFRKLQSTARSKGNHTEMILNLDWRCPFLWLFSSVYRKTFHIQSNILRLGHLSGLHIFTVSLRLCSSSIPWHCWPRWWSYDELFVVSKLGGAGPHKHFVLCVSLSLGHVGKKTPREQHNPWLFGGQCKAWLRCHALHVATGVEPHVAPNWREMR